MCALSRCSMGILLACSVSLAVAQQSAMSPQALHSLADREVDKLVTLYTDGFATEVRSLRSIGSGPLFDDAPPALVAFFVLQGADLSNTHQEFVAIFGVGQRRDMSRIQGPKERPMHLVATAMVGSRRTRTLDPNSLHIEPGKISMSGLRWVQGNPGCCPSQEIQVSLMLPRTLLFEQNSDVFPMLSEIEKRRSK